MHERQLNSDSPRVRWVGVALSQEVASGDPAALRRALLLLAKHWMEKGEASIPEPSVLREKHGRHDADRPLNFLAASRGLPPCPP